MKNEVKMSDRGRRVDPTPPTRERSRSRDKRCDEEVSENAHESSHGNTPCQNYVPSLDNGNGVLHDHDQEMNAQHSSDNEDEDEDEENNIQESEEEIQQYNARMELLKLTSQGPSVSAIAPYFLNTLKELEALKNLTPTESNYNRLLNVANKILLNFCTDTIGRDSFILDEPIYHLSSCENETELKEQYEANKENFKNVEKSCLISIGSVREANFQNDKSFHEQLKKFGVEKPVNLNPQKISFADVTKNPPPIKIINKKAQERAEITQTRNREKSFQTVDQVVSAKPKLLYYKPPAYDNVANRRIIKFNSSSFVLNMSDKLDHRELRKAVQEVLDLENISELISSWSSYQSGPFKVIVEIYYRSENESFVNKILSKMDVKLHVEPRSASLNEKKEKAVIRRISYVISFLDSKHKHFKQLFDAITDEYDKSLIEKFTSEAKRLRENRLTRRRERAPVNQVSEGTMENVSYDDV